MNMPRREASEDTNPADTLILDFWPPELSENKFLLIKSPNLWYLLWKFYQINTDPEKEHKRNLSKNHFKKEYKA